MNCAACSIRTFAYIDAPRPELYDLQRDPDERHNLAAANASLAASLARKLEEVERRYAGQRIIRARAAGSRNRGTPALTRLCEFAILRCHAERSEPRRPQG